MTGNKFLDILTTHQSKKFTFLKRFYAISFNNNQL